MKRKAALVVFFSMVFYIFTACETVMPTEAEETVEPEIIIIKDELAVPMVEGAEELETEVVETSVPLAWEEPVEKMYIVMESANVTKDVANGEVDESDFAADVQGTVVTLGEEINGLLKELGWPDTFEETVSNPRFGSDKKFVYEGIVIYTNPKNRKDIVNGIEYCGEEKTLSGIGVGSTRADIEAAYGIDYVMDPDYITYTCTDGATMSFRMEGEECVHIELSWK